MKKLTSQLLCLCIVMFNFQTAVFAETKSGQINENVSVPNDAAQYIQEKYSDIVELAKLYQEAFQLDGTTLHDLTIGEPYVILDLDETQQDELYYYPILDAEDKIILVVSVMGTTEGWNLSISTEMTEELNNIEYVENNFVFLESEDNIVAESKDDAIVIEGEENEIIEEYTDLDYDELVEEVSEKIDEQFVKTDILEEEETCDMLYGYTRGFRATSTSASKVCSLYNPKGQGAYGMCWAASVATIANYIKGTNRSAQSICLLMEIGLNDGATISQSATALNKLGVYYAAHPLSIMSWTLIKKNINNKYPILVAAKSGSKGHMVTLYGYQELYTNYIQIWNSGLNGGAGGSQVIQFKSSGSTFSYGGYTYKWKEYVSYY